MSILEESSGPHRALQNASTFDSDSMSSKRKTSVEIQVQQTHSISSLEKSDNDADEDGPLQDFGTDDPFPMDLDAPEEQQFTFRAVFVGCALGAVISASK